MLKFPLRVAGPVVLLIAGLLAWDAEATTLTGFLGIQSVTDYSLLNKVGCSGDPNDKICQPEAMVSCKQGEGSAAALVCRCESCSAHAPEEDSADQQGLLACICPANRCCNWTAGKWCCN
jgi:hypothetical protein